MKESYIRVEWPACQHFMQEPDCLRLLDSQDIMVPEELYEVYNTENLSELPFDQGQVIELSGIGHNDIDDVDFIKLNGKWYECKIELLEEDGGYPTRGFIGESSYSEEEMDIMTEFNPQPLVFYYKNVKDFDDYVDYDYVELVDAVNRQIFVQIGTNYSDGYIDSIYKFDTNSLNMNQQHIADLA